jgi:hypothetical protein
LDIHCTGTAAQFNGTGTNNAYVYFQNAGANKWRVGNLYNAGANDFNVYNIGLAANALSFLSATSAATFANNVTAKNLFFNTNTQTVKISNPVATGSFGNNIFIGNGGDSVTYTSADTGSYNTALGNISLYNITTGYRNAVIGNASMSGITTGFFNVAIGDNAGRFYGGVAALNTTNNKSIFIGRETQASADGNTNEIVIGNELIGNGSNSTTIGNSSITKTIIAGNLLLGSVVDDTVNKLQVTGKMTISDLITSTIGNNKLIFDANNATTGYQYVRLKNTSGHLICGIENSAGGNLQTGSSAYATVLTTGTATDLSLGVNQVQNLRINGSTGGVSLSTLAGTGSRAVLADANGLLSAPVSDISVKENIKPIQYGLNEILKMKPVWFDYIDEYKNYGKGRQNGNIAQEMQQIIPEAVFTTPSTDKMGINYDQLHAIYIKAIQELNDKLVRNNIN